jgi:urocanate hydratase
MSRNNKWTYELYSEEYWTSGEDFDTKEEAIEAGKEAALDEEEISSFYVGQIKDFIPKINTWRITDDLMEDAAEQCGKASDSFLDGITEEQRQRLSELLDEALSKWLDETNNHPDFYGIDNVKVIAILDR